MSPLTLPAAHCCYTEQLYWSTVCSQQADLAAMQGRGRASNLGPRPPYQPGMQQGAWNQPQQQQSFPQQYALVPINSPGMLNGAHGPVMSLSGAQGFALQPGMPMPQIASPQQYPGAMNGFNGGVAIMPAGSPFMGTPPPGRGGPRPPPGQPPGWSQGRGPGRGPPGRGPPGTPGMTGRGPSPGRGRGTPGRGKPQHPGGRGGTPQSSASKEERRNVKAMAKLDKQVQAEKPRVYKALNAEDSQEAARWQAERRKHYPTAANQEKKAQAATDRQARGELEPDQALRRQRLQEVLVRQRELGLAQLAGTQDMHIDGAPSFASPGRGGRGRGGRGGRSDRGGRGRSPFGRGPGRGPGRGSPHMPFPSPSGAKRPFSHMTPDGTANGMTDGPEPGKRAKTEADGLAALMQYGSDEEEDGAEEGAGGDAQDGAQAGPSEPQTAEEKQALYQKHKEQVERQQQQHLAKVERKKKQQELWASQGRGRGRGAPARGRGGRNLNPQQTQQAQRAQRQPTLLQKLLVKDIRKDHSHILQCFRFMVNNNFLQDVGKKPLVFPEPPPTLRDILPSVADDKEASDSDASDSDEEAIQVTTGQAASAVPEHGEEDIEGSDADEE